MGSNQIARKYINIKHDYREIKCEWRENKLVYVSQYNSRDFMLGSDYEKFLQLQALQKAVSDLNRLVSAHYGLPDATKLRGACTEVLQQLDLYESDTSDK